MPRRNPQSGPSSQNRKRKFEEAESLLLSGYDGMRSAERTTNAANTSRFTQGQAGDAIVQFYADWGKPAKQTEWTEKLKAGRNTATTPAR